MINRLIIHGVRNKPAISIVAFLFLQSLAFSQIKLSIEQHHFCENTTINVSVLADDFIDVSAFTLFIQIDTLVINYESLTNAHQNLSGGALHGNFNSNIANPSIVIVWNRLSPASIISGKLFDLVLSYKEGNSVLNFAENSEIALTNLVIVEDVIYIDGSVSQLIDEHPQSLHIAEGGQAVFNINQSEGSSYSWQQNSGNGWLALSNISPYSGVDTHEIVISNVPDSFNNYMFRCIVTNNDCQMISDSATLMVSPLQTSERNINSHVLNVYPIPCQDNLYYQYDLSLSGVNVKLVNLLGKPVFQEWKEELTAGNIESIGINGFQPGLYFLQLTHEKVVLSTRKIIIK